jgi:hypothetical protein
MSDGNVTLASNVLGTIGTVLWCIQLVPQIWYNYRRKKTDGFPAAMMLLWASCTSDDDNHSGFERNVLINSI